MQKGGKGLMYAEPSRRRKGFTLVEMVMVVLFIGILTAIAVPRLNLAVISRYKAEATARKIVTDLRRTRGLAIANAATNTTGFELWMDGSSGGGTRTLYQIRDRSTGPPTTVDEHTIDSDVSVYSDQQTIRFGPLGNILESSPGSYPGKIDVSAEGTTYKIEFEALTGAILWK